MITLQKKFQKITIVIVIAATILLSTRFTSNDFENNYNKLFFDNESTNLIAEIKDDHPISAEIVGEDYTGIGSPLNVLHKANRTDSNVDYSFENGSTDSYQIPLGEDWEGVKLHAEINNLYDQKNWVNGTYTFGDDDGTYGVTEDDTSDIVNSYQNWTFSENDPNNNKDMSGNYYDGNSIAGKNALELLMHGQGSPNSWHYDENDYCEWNTSFSVDRGYIQNAILNFEANPYYLIDFNSWELQVYVNGIKIFIIGTYSLESYGAQQWHQFSIPLGLWTNTTNVFSDQLNDSVHSLAFQLRYVASDATYTGFENGDYQQIFLANIELDIQSRVKAQQIGLELNDELVISEDYGSGVVTQYSSWTSSNVNASFSALDNPNYNYSIDFSSNLTVFSEKVDPKTNYETNAEYLGIKFTNSNNTDCVWDFYSYFSVPTGYTENNFTLFIPDDWTITWVSNPQEPTINISSECDQSTPGLLIIQIEDITPTPDGYWKFQASSPNYISDMQIYKNTTDSVDLVNWDINNVFYSNDYVNITAQLNTTNVNFTNPLSTKAYLNIYFPNNSLWVSKVEEVTVTASGFIQFSVFQIPALGPDYIVGDYLLFISWNNSIEDTSLNETGMAFSTFKVKHYSHLIPDTDSIESLIEGDSISLRINFFDIVSGQAIEAGTLFFTNLHDEVQFMSEIAPGYYYSELIASNIHPGNNSLQIFANHPLYSNSTKNISVYVELKTVIDIPESPRYDAIWNNTFEIHVNYSEESSGDEILDADIEVEWIDSFSITMGVGNVYIITFNSTATNSNEVNNIEITISSYGYQQQQEIIEIKTIARNGYVELGKYLNGDNISTIPSLEIEYGDSLNLSLSYFDELSNELIQDVEIVLSGVNYSRVLFDSKFWFIIDTENLTIGTYYLTFTLSVPNYLENTELVDLKINPKGIDLEIFVQNNDFSVLTQIEVPINTELNISGALYHSSDSSQVEEISLSLEGINETYYIFQNLDNIHEFLIDTGKMGLGIHFVSILSHKDNYQQISKVIQVKIRPILTNITSQHYNSSYTILPGDDLNLGIIIEDLDNGGLLAECEVSYSWRFGSGTLEENENHVYLVPLENIPEGIHSINIIVYKGSNYKFDLFTITINVVAPSTDSMPNWVFYSMGVVIAALASSFIAYQKYFKYPKIVRDIRKLKRMVKRGVAFNPSTKTRKDLFMDAYMELVKNSLPGKVQTQMKSTISKGNKKNAFLTDADNVLKELLPAEVPSEAEIISPNNEKTQFISSLTTSQNIDPVQAGPPTHSKSPPSSAQKDIADNRLEKSHIKRNGLRKSWPKDITFKEKPKIKELKPKE